MSGTIFTTDIEKENLEAHVELCWERYRRLEEKITQVDAKVEMLGDDIRTMREEYLQEIKEMREDAAKDSRALKTAILTSSATIIAALLGFVAMMINMPH